MTLKELAKFDALRIEMDDLDKRRLQQIAELQSSLTRVEGEHERLKAERDRMDVQLAGERARVDALAKLAISYRELERYNRDNFPELVKASRYAPEWQVIYKDRADIYGQIAVVLEELVSLPAPFGGQ